MINNLTFKTIITGSIIWLLSSCSQPTGDNYIGYWVEKDKKLTEAVEIRKDGQKLYLIAENIEVPASYNKEDKTLKAEISNGLATVAIVMNLQEETGMLKVSMGNKSEEMTRISKEEAEQLKTYIASYYNPDFFVGGWKSDVAQEDPFNIIKEGDTYYYVGSFLGKKAMKYDEKNHNFKYQIGFTTLTLRRSGDNEITGNGNRVYRKVKR